jgi:hypothetical protein
VQYSPTRCPVPFSVQLDPFPVTVTKTGLVAPLIPPTRDPELVSVAPFSTRSEPLTTSRENCPDGTFPESESEAVEPLTITAPGLDSVTTSPASENWRVAPMSSSFATAPLDPFGGGPIVAGIGLLTLALSRSVGGATAASVFRLQLVEVNQSVELTPEPPS